MYAIYSACERFGILPPNVKPKWDDNERIEQMDLLNYDMIRKLEEAEIIAAQAQMRF